MAKYIVSTPEAGHAGKVGGVEFHGGKAVIDEDAHPGELAYCRSAGYRIEEDDHAPDESGQDRTSPDGGPGRGDGPFDPADHNADEVLAHLEAADLEEAERVLQAESDGKARKGILNAGGPLLAAKQGENQ